MSRRIENECAYCANEYAEIAAIVGQDWKVYCSQECAKSGELLSAYETAKIYLNQFSEPELKAA